MNSMFMKLHRGKFLVNNVEEIIDNSIIDLSYMGYFEYENSVVNYFKNIYMIFGRYYRVITFHNGVDKKELIKCFKCTI